MCGIAGFIDFTGRSDRRVLEQMTRVLEHRGPDGSGHFLHSDDAVVGLGHRRLSIIDLSVTAAQPMAYDDLHIVFNGEIYNYREIRGELISLGHQFQTQGDTEVILHAFREWGQQFVHRMVGMFSFVLLDAKSGKLIAYRDRVGVKPFYYYWNDSLFLFASELKAFHEHTGFIRELNNDALGLFLQYGNVPAPHCIFKNTFKLQPGHFLEFDLRLRKYQVNCYWNVYDYFNAPKLKIDFKEAIEEAESRLIKACQYRMVADVPIGVFLSGGYDSTCVTALLQHNSSVRIKTFTIGMDTRELDEAVHAAKVAAHLGTEHNSYYCTDEDARAIVPILPEFFDEPFADSSAIPTILVSRMARKQVTVALSADGGDELFGGYSKYMILADRVKKIRKVPAILAGSMSGILRRFPISTAESEYKLERLAGMLSDRNIQAVFNYSGRLYTELELDRLLLTKASKLPTAYDSTELKEQYFDELSYMTAMDIQTYLTDDIMHKVDRSSMSICLEAREPLLDHHVVEWAAQLPSDFKIRNGKQKFILREIVHKYVPPTMMERPKQGFSVPVDKWLRNGLSAMMHEYLGPKFIKKQALFDEKSVSRLLESFVKSGRTPHQKIWYLLMFQLWYDRWMKKL